MNLDPEGVKLPLTWEVQAGVSDPGQAQGQEVAAAVVPGSGPPCRPSRLSQLCNTPQLSARSLGPACCSSPSTNSHTRAWNTVLPPGTPKAGSSRATSTRRSHTEDMARHDPVRSELQPKLFIRPTPGASLKVQQVAADWIITC